METNDRVEAWKSNVRHKLRSAMYLAECHELQYQAIESVVFDLLTTHEREERIICAAVRASDGYVFRGQWHATAMYAPFGLQGMPKYKDERPMGDDQGFVTSKDRYVTREEAWEIAVAAGQLNSRPHQEGTLYSEDLMYAESFLPEAKQ